MNVSSLPEPTTPSIPWRPALLLAVVTALVFARSLTCGFVNFDDNLYVIHNPWVPEGLTVEGWRWAWTTFYASNWHPLTWLSLMLDAQVFGVRAAGFHFTNVVLHVLCAVMVFRTLTLATGDAWRSFAVALIFAVHPLRVESVTWIAERKDVLSVFLGLVAMECHLRYARRRSALMYVQGVVWFALSLMAKPTMVTLPCVMVLLDVWPLGRASIVGTTYEPQLKMDPPRPGWRRLALEKLPWFALSLASSFITSKAQEQGGATIYVKEFGIGARLANMVVSYVRYLEKMVWPKDLACFYPLPQEWPLWAVGGSIVLLLGVTAGVWRVRKSSPWLLVGWLWFLGTLFPMIGLVQVGVQSMADRYSYFPMIGVLVAVAWSIPDAWVTGRKVRAGASILAGVAVALGLATVIQIGVWRDSVTLFSHDLKVTEHSILALSNLAIALDEQGGDPQQGIALLREAVEIDPTFPECWNNLGMLYLKTDDFPKAADSYRRVLAPLPKDLLARNGLAVACFNQGQTQEARKILEGAVKDFPQYAPGRHELARIDSRLGDTRAALEQLQETVKLTPDDVDTLLDLGFLLNQLHRPSEAVKVLAHAMDLRPDNAMVRLQMGDALSQAGDSRCIGEWHEAIRLDPTLSQAQMRLAAALASSGMISQGLKEYQAALRGTPGDVNLRIDYASALGQSGGLDEAATELEKVIAIDPRSVAAHHNLGVVRFRMNQLDLAQVQFRKVLELDPGNVNAQQALSTTEQKLKEAQTKP